MNEEISKKISEIMDKKELIKEYGKNIEGIEEMLSTLSELESALQSLFPKTLDYKNKFIIEEKIKAIVSFFDIKLRLRQEKGKMLMNKIELSEDGDDEKVLTEQEKLEVARKVFEELRKSKKGEEDGKEESC